MIKRFGVKTSSGSWYYIEDHSHLFGHPTWHIYMKKEIYHIIGLKDENDEKNNILGTKIEKIQEFVGKIVIFDKEKVEDPFTIWKLVRSFTSKVSEVIEFK